MSDKEVEDKIARYKKAVSDYVEKDIKQTILIQTLWAKIAELIEDPQEMADFITEAYQ